MLDSIKPAMHLDKAFFMRVYGYELTWPGFAENVLTRLEILGCSRAKEYYTCITAEYNHRHEQEMKNTAEWYIKQDFSKKKGDELLRKKQREVELQRKRGLSRECVARQILKW